MTNDEAVSQEMSRAVSVKYDSQARHDSAMRKIEQIIIRSQRGGRPAVFTREDRARVVELMGGRVKKPSATPARDNVAPPENE